MPLIAYWNAKNARYNDDYDGLDNNSVILSPYSEFDGVSLVNSELFALGNISDSCLVGKWVRNTYNDPDYAQVLVSISHYQGLDSIITGSEFTIGFQFYAMPTNNSPRDEWDGGCRLHAGACNQGLSFRFGSGDVSFLTKRHPTQSEAPACYYLSGPPGSGLYSWNDQYAHEHPDDCRPIYSKGEHVSNGGWFNVLATYDGFGSFNWYINDGVSPFQTHECESFDGIVYPSVYLTNAGYNDHLEDKYTRIKFKSLSVYDHVLSEEQRNQFMSQGVLPFGFPKASWDFDNYTHRKKIVVKGENIFGRHENIPVRVEFPDLEGEFRHVMQEAGYTFAVTQDGETRLDAEVFGATKDGIDYISLFFLAPLLEEGKDATFYFYYCDIEGKSYFGGNEGRLWHNDTTVKRSAVAHYGINLFNN